MTEITLYSSVAPSIGAFFITARDEVAYKVGTQINLSTPGGDEHVKFLPLISNIIPQTGIQNTQTCQVEVIILN